MATITDVIVDILVISEADLKHMEIDRSSHADRVPPHLVGLDAQQRRARISAMRQQLEGFCRAHGIRLQYLPLGPETMNSRETRPAWRYADKDMSR